MQFEKKLPILGCMTLEEFSVLDNEQKSAIVWEANFLTYREESAFVIMLYQVFDFYVEAFYNRQNNRLVKFSSFSSERRLELYFDVSLN